MLLIEDADRIEIRIADLLANLKVIVAVIDKRLGVLAEMERPQPLDHDVACHGHLDAFSRCTRVGPATTPPLVCLSSKPSFPVAPPTIPFRDEIPSYYPLHSSATTTIPRGRPPVDDVTSIEGRIVESRSIQQVNRALFLLARHSPLSRSAAVLTRVVSPATLGHAGRRRGGREVVCGGHVRRLTCTAPRFIMRHTGDRLEIAPLSLSLCLPPFLALSSRRCARSVFPRSFPSVDSSG
ncbi:hypothetical protein ALC56_10030 [Trachymyrmex septentrionalis]|uniref:Uncharacterized protein n=1 Tax=Trachymyrmex septentrionalis TaxID=34720 RepID=A0A195F4T4_9HYME|nr:hypothetical protein ALC56_10030 [Trachymyrmex septentrionalis]